MWDSAGNKRKWKPKGFLYGDKKQKSGFPVEVGNDTPLSGKTLQGVEK